MCNAFISLSLSSSIKEWKTGVEALEMDSGAGWKLIFKLLARGRLYDEARERPLKVTGAGLVAENKALFSDVL